MEQVQGDLPTRTENSVRKQTLKSPAARAGLLRHGRNQIRPMFLVQDNLAVEPEPAFRAENS